MSRYDPDGTAIVVGVWDGTGAARVMPVGLRLGFGGANVHTLVFQTGRPGRIDDYAAASGDAADAAPRLGVPLGRRRADQAIEDRLWGVMSEAASAREEPLSADTEERLAAFTELIVTALVNAEAQAALNASRARDCGRRRPDAAGWIERNLHDGSAAAPGLPGPARLREAQGGGAQRRDELADRLEGAVTEVTEIPGRAARDRPRHPRPAILTEGGLPPALRCSWPAAAPSRSALTSRWRSGCPSRSRSQLTTRSPRRFDQHRQARARLRRRGGGGCP